MCYWCAFRGYVTVARRQCAANPLTLEGLEENSCMRAKPSLSLLFKANNEIVTNVNTALTGMRFGHHANLWTGSAWYYSKGLSQAASWCLLHIFPWPEALVVKSEFLLPSTQEGKKIREKKSRTICGETSLIFFFKKKRTKANTPLRVLYEDGLDLPQSGPRVNIHLPWWNSS